jgi:GNAT superfamily N-acetyltransferase
MLPTRLSASQLDDAVTVLCDAFHDYPVMRFVLGDSTVDYESRLRRLIGFFASARFLRDEPVLGVHRAGNLVAVALITPPAQEPEPPELSSLLERTWEELGAAERARYEAFEEATDRFDIEAPHYHLNMIGVRRAHAGQGLGRRLLQAVHQLSDRDQLSTGVTLSTENAGNVPLYLHFGYRVVGHAKISDELETWVFVRERR